ncbi:MAG TPA: PepSY-associated TM helix domain-containing protein [Methylophilaceae bacterium]|nr:PepSY-associated TM helix domain-containing protein [Methylophilaceae bacterium]
MQTSTNQQKRAFWLRQLYLWHWISSAACLVGMLLFAITGLTLNNADHIEAKPVVSKKMVTLPAVVLKDLQVQPASSKAPLPLSVTTWIAKTTDVDAANRSAEWSDGEVYVSLPRPGGDAWLTIDTESGELNYELTRRGWVSYLNDLHKGRNTGVAWSWFLDVFSVAALVFSLSGLCLLYMHSSNRPSTWPLVGLGIVLPLVLAILFIH